MVPSRIVYVSYPETLLYDVYSCLDSYERKNLFAALLVAADSDDKNTEKNTIINFIDSLGIELVGGGF